MNIDKLRGHLTAAKNELNVIINTEVATLTGAKSDAAAKGEAGKALQVAGRLNTILSKLDAKIDDAMARLAPKAKKDKAPVAKK